MTCENNSIVADILMRCLSTCELNHGYPCFSANQVKDFVPRYSMPFLFKQEQ